MTELELQRALRALGARLDAEATADVSAVVVAQLPAARARTPRRWARPVAIVLAILLLGAATAVAASDTVRSWLDVRGIDARTVGTLPTTVEVDDLDDLGAGTPVDGQSAEDVLGHRLPTSDVLGAPAAILSSSETAVPTVTLVWSAAPRLPAGTVAPGVGALLTIIPGYDPDNMRVIGKSLIDETQVEFVTMPSGDDAVWIEGAPHAVTLFDGSEARFRLAENVLIWSDGDDTRRLETTLERDEAVAIAASLAG